LRERYGCQQTDRVTPGSTLVRFGAPTVEDSGSLAIRTAASCKDSTGVAYYTLVGGAHEWPRSATLSATTVMWRFFAAHARA
jgi:poly(3-hydroxybutyrate) depolymerase